MNSREPSPIASGRRLLIREVAERLRTSKSKVLRLIATGQLRAINTSTRPDSLRPRWVVDAGDLDAFEDSRSNVVTANQQQRRRRPQEVVVPNYFAK